MNKAHKHMPKKIIVLESEKKAQDLYRRILSVMGYSVTLVKNIAEAETAIKRNTCDLFITELISPACIGTDLIAMIKNKNARARILLITGALAGKERMTYVKKFSLHGCLNKPFSIYEFMTTIERSLRDGYKLAP